MPVTPRVPLNRYSSRRTREVLGGKSGETGKLTKAEERARRALEEAKTGLRRGNIPDRLSATLINQSGRGTSAARIRKYRRLGQYSSSEEDEEELDKQAAEAEMGIASPLPRTLIRPTIVSIKKIHGLDGEVSEFKE